MMFYNANFITFKDLVNCLIHDKLLCLKLIFKVKNYNHRYIFLKFNSTYATKKYNMGIFILIKFHVSNSYVILLKLKSQNLLQPMILQNIQNYFP